MTVIDAQQFIYHASHRIEIAWYGDKDDPESVTIECKTCHCVLYELPQDETKQADEIAQDTVDALLDHYGIENDYNEESVITSTIITAEFASALVYLPSNLPEHVLKRIPVRVRDSLDGTGYVQDPDAWKYDQAFIEYQGKEYGRE